MKLSFFFLILTWARLIKKKREGPIKLEMKERKLQPVSQKYNHKRIL